MIKSMQRNMLRAVVLLICFGSSNSNITNRGAFNAFINAYAVPSVNSNSNSQESDSNSTNSLTPSSSSSSPFSSLSSSESDDDYDDVSVDEDRFLQHSSVSNAYQIQRERSRNFRLQSLRSEMLSQLGRDPTITVSPELRARVESVREQLLPPFAGWPMDQRDTTQRRCYSASCDVPHRVNVTLWNNLTSLGLKLFLPVLRDRTPGIQLQSATLNLFLKPGAVSQRRCTEQGEGEEEAADCQPVTGLVVSVYTFLRPLSIRKRDRVVNRRRLLDVKFVPARGNQWVTLNLQSVAMDWRRHRRNFGIEVTVRDDNDTEIDAKSLFVSPNCSVGREVGCREGTDSNSYRQLPWFINLADKFPYLDLTTIDNTANARRMKRSSPAHHPTHLFDLMDQASSS